MNIVVFGLSITSSWGNGHATTYRGLLREMAGRGHSILFLERDAPWYARNRDLPEPGFCRTVLYQSLPEMMSEFGREVREADCVIVGSYVKEGVEIGKWVTGEAKGITAFYDIDTPVTLADLQDGTCAYLTADLIPRYRLYLSFTGGPTLRVLERQFGSPMARPLYCSVDPDLHYPLVEKPTWDLGYLGTYSNDRQPSLERLLCKPATRWPKGRFVVAGAQYPAEIRWPANTDRIEHLAPDHHRGFYCSQRFTLNLTRRAMRRAGYSPSVRLFEAGACGVPVISDPWPGLDEFFTPGKEILVATEADQVLEILRSYPDEIRRTMGERARTRTLQEHTASRRAEELEGYLLSA
ncbi:glycosyltransferase [Geomonas sp. Red32]|uniref:CgeB family protein n=1 Tax=Geomonas sp. Red32 TaxID=2912856 RepID=UPI00202CBBF8|nr:glycosyltransferase [Geomonas sp. Red32]MCM0083254.1 glycosyltransferase [Geomonas sp. Red32]